ncbi:hypothetical protein CEUSTIGMA_g3401.t1 [Chlamydomonas eustigma]|uniref:Uncharacterized protein n=1 Tax=Chlamydomonas eustigma TaxID=1157962 RepID=A0A250WYN7_9CHLO|nr:hypothetical protein CEUSTIGMA_g3401.t1 [Chlamydomonas eustigma]|eukprot:GAX75958.1 hypothetical protein CEUSTIGMA_g3401.t1 [Chlamydomonas eustigma]
MALASRTTSHAMSLTETEAACILAPENAFEEEKRLQQARTATESSDRAAVILDSQKFNALEQLLNTSELYSKFLSEQLKDVEARTDAEATTTAAATAAAKKAATNPGAKRTRKGAAKAEEAAKKELTPTQKLLPLLNADLRDYQLKGVKWLTSLWSNGLNGILADQMGLGKTVQTIGFLSHLKSKGIHGPFLVLGPLSTLPNWIAEFERFCPSLPAVLYHGSKQEREALRNGRLKPPGVQVPDNFPVIVTSYEIIIADAKFFQTKYRFKYLVVDEGHRLKNFECRLIRELKQIPAENRLLLSGTPLQNNLAELWSLLNFLMPDVFSSLKDFESWFDFSSVVGQDGADKEILAAEQRNKVVSKLHAILKPFVLRRLKSDVAIGLPRKAEILLYSQMTDVQKALNKQLLDGTLKGGMAALAEREGGSSAAVGNLNNVLMQMRKICNHPDLITAPFSRDFQYPTPEDMVKQCGKMQLLDRLLEKLHAKGHKVLIFSQMTKVLDLLESYLDQKGHRACRIDGSIPWQERQRNIMDFNSDPKTWLFLLSTRAGGLGINLTSADTVIIYDSDWNPHQDLQAMDRCHRIGQVRPVLVFRLATAHSVEGKMLRRAADKMALERLVIKKGVFKEITSSEESTAGSSSATSMSAAELMELLRSDVSLKDVPQSGVISEKALDAVLDRSYLEGEGKPFPLPENGVGYEMMQSHGGGASLLQNINGDGGPAAAAPPPLVPSKKAKK